MTKINENTTHGVDKLIENINDNSKLHKYSYGFYVSISFFMLFLFVFDIFFLFYSTVSSLGWILGCCFVEIPIVFVGFYAADIALVHFDMYNKSQTRCHTLLCRRDAIIKAEQKKD